MSHFSHKEIIDELSRNFGDGFADFSEADKEAIAICEETLLDSYLETGELDDTLIRKAVSTRGRLRRDRERGRGGPGERAGSCRHPRVERVAERISA